MCPVARLSRRRDRKGAVRDLVHSSVRRQRTLRREGGGPIKYGVCALTPPPVPCLCCSLYHPYCSWVEDWLQAPRDAIWLARGGLARSGFTRPHRHGDRTTSSELECVSFFLCGMPFRNRQTRCPSLLEWRFIIGRVRTRLRIKQHSIIHSLRTRVMAGVPLVLSSTAAATNDATPFD